MAGLVKELDALVAAEEERKLAAVVNFIGEANDEAKEKIKRFGDKHSLKKVSLAATTEADKFKISDDAEVTVMLYRGKKVKFNYALSKGGLDEKAIATIVEGANKMLAEPPEEPKQKPKKAKEKGRKKPGKETKKELKSQADKDRG